MLHECLFLTFFGVVVSQKCLNLVFDKVAVNIRYFEGERTEQLISGCVNPQTLDYQPGKNFEIIIQNANIPVLLEHVIANFQEKLWIKIETSTLDMIEAEAFFNLPQLQRLFLNNNTISWIDVGVFKNMSHLKIISLQHNKLISFDANTFDDLPELETVDLCGNYLSSFEYTWFNKTPKLSNIFLSSNSFRKIPKATFKTLSSMKVLFLDNNLIENIDRQAFDGLNNLLYLNLLGNKMKVLDIDFSSLLQLRELIFSHNTITFISDEVLHSLTNKLCYLNLKSNPLQCSCFDKVLKWGYDKNIEIDWLCKEDNPICIVPKIDAEECIQHKTDEFYSEYEVYFNLNCNNSIKKDFVCS